MKKATVITHGYFGDIIFASSVAKKLKHEKRYDSVEYIIGFPQVAGLINMGYIDEISLSAMKTENGIETYIGPCPQAISSGDDDVFQLGTLSLTVPPPVDYQLQCGIIHSLSPEYELYCPEPDKVIEYRDKFVTESKGKPIVAVGRDWFKKSFEFTEYEYWNNADVPNMGYGGRYRDLDSVFDRLKETYHLVFVGAQHSKQTDVTPLGDDLTLEEYSYQMAACDVFLGTEGGLSNIAAGVGIPTVIDPSYVAMLYGKRGCIRQMDEPKLGPKYYFGEDKHKELELFVQENMSKEDIVEYFVDNIYSCIDTLL